MKKERWIILCALLLISPWPILALSYHPAGKANRIALPAENPGLSAAVAQTFSRAPYFVVIDLSSGQLESLTNPYADEQHAVGIRVALLLGAKKVGTVMAKKIGPEPFNNLTRKGVKVYLTEAATVGEAILAYRARQTAQLTQPNVPTHFGLQDQGQGAGAPPCPLAPPTVPVAFVTPVPGRTPSWPAPVPPASMAQQRPAATTGPPMQIPELGAEVVGYGDGGVMIHRVYRNGVAEQSGLTASDYIVELNQQPVVDVIHFIYLVTTTKPERPLTIRVVHQGRMVTHRLLISDNPLAGVSLPADAAPPYGAPVRTASATGAGRQAAGQGINAAQTVVQLPEMGIEVVGHPAGGGVSIKRVYQGSWGEQGGLQAADLLIKLDGKNISDLGALIALIKAATPEAPLPVHVIRQGRVHVLQITIGEGEMETATVPADAASPYTATQPSGATNRGVLRNTGPGQVAGLALSTTPLTLPELGLVVIDQQGQGVLVTDVLPRSNAQAAGLAAGDMIYKINSHPIFSTNQLKRYLDPLPPGSEVRIRLFRHGRSEIRLLSVGPAR